MSAKDLSVVMIRVISNCFVVITIFFTRHLNVGFFLLVTKLFGLLRVLRNLWDLV